ncbi:hypothetical protein SALB_01463 [Streptomyces noursei]|uniref:Uncharacterized protein n=1 Tax=Streptomyces noursei TaxID=1971 RepID=A0A401QTT8_STRNR|nr:hypothetical protein SALB_01463 [Streptomyces noursei]
MLHDGLLERGVPPHTLVTVGALSATLSSKVIPIALSCTLGATTITAMTRPITSVAMPLFRPGLLLPGSSPVVSFGAFTEARTVCESRTTTVGCSRRLRISRAKRRSSSWMVSAVPSSRQRPK